LKPEGSRGESIQDEPRQEREPITHPNCRTVTRRPHASDGTHERAVYSQLGNAWNLSLMHFLSRTKAVTRSYASGRG